MSHPYELSNEGNGLELAEWVALIPDNRPGQSRTSVRVPNCDPALDSARCTVDQHLGPARVCSDGIHVAALPQMRPVAIHNTAETAEYLRQVALAIPNEVQQSFQPLTKPYAVNKAFPVAVKLAVEQFKYYATNQDRLGVDFNATVKAAVHQVDEAIKYGITPRDCAKLLVQAGIFLTPMRGVKLTAAEIDSLGGVVKLEQLTAHELEKHGLQLQVTEDLQEVPLLEGKAVSWRGATTEKSVQIKLHDYLLNPEHPSGMNKARFLSDVLGFSRENMDGLAQQLKFDPHKALFSENTVWGPKYIQTIPITGANGVCRDIPFVWIHNIDDTVRLVGIKSFPRRITR